MMLPDEVLPDEVLLSDVVLLPDEVLLPDGKVLPGEMLLPDEMTCYTLRRMLLRLRLSCNGRALPHACQGRE